MDFWGSKINISKEAASRQVAIISRLSPEKRLKIACDFANMGVHRTYEWIQSKYPEWDRLEVQLEFARLMYYEKGEVSEVHWQHYKQEMEKRIRRNWAKRFRNMMKKNGLSYEDVARYGEFKNGKVVEATISRGLPAFAKLAVVLFEKQYREES